MFRVDSGESSRPRVSDSERSALDGATMFLSPLTKAQETSWKSGLKGCEIDQCISSADTEGEINSTVSKLCWYRTFVIRCTELYLSSIDMLMLYPVATALLGMRYFP